MIRTRGSEIKAAGTKVSYNNYSVKECFSQSTTNHFIKKSLADAYQYIPSGTAYQTYQKQKQSLINTKLHHETPVRPLVREEGVFNKQEKTPLMIEIDVIREEKYHSKEHEPLGKARLHKDTYINPEIRHGVSSIKDIDAGTLIYPTETRYWKHNYEQDFRQKKPVNAFFVSNKAPTRPAPPENVKSSLYWKSLKESELRTNIAPVSYEKFQARTIQTLEKPLERQGIDHVPGFAYGGKPLEEPQEVYPILHRGKMMNESMNLEIGKNLSEFAVVSDMKDLAQNAAERSEASKKKYTDQINDLLHPTSSTIYGMPYQEYKAKFIQHIEKELPGPPPKYSTPISQEKIQLEKRRSLFKLSGRRTAW